MIRVPLRFQMARAFDESRSSLVWGEGSGIAIGPLDVSKLEDLVLYLNLAEMELVLAKLCAEVAIKQLSCQGYMLFLGSPRWGITHPARDLHFLALSPPVPTGIRNNPRRSPLQSFGGHIMPNAVLHRSWGKGLCGKSSSYHSSQASHSPHNLRMPSNLSPTQRGSF